MLLEPIPEFREPLIRIINFLTINFITITEINNVALGRQQRALILDMCH